MAKISRKDFKKSTAIATETAKSYIEFVNQCKKIHKYLLSEIEKLQERVNALEGKPKQEEQPLT
jgi:vacuolar-type H+-ATPase subunit D/Vma8